jgi:hypothetical protein
MSGEVKDVSGFCELGCKVLVHLKSKRMKNLEKGKHTTRVLEAIYLRFEPNREANIVVDPSKV